MGNCKIEAFREYLMENEKSENTINSFNQWNFYFGMISFIESKISIFCRWKKFSK